MISLEDRGAMGLHKEIKQTFEGKDIPISNIIGFSSDTCNVMFGEFNGLATLMSKDIPGLVAIKLWRNWLLYSSTLQILL